MGETNRVYIQRLLIPSFEFYSKINHYYTVGIVIVIIIPHTSSSMYIHSIVGLLKYYNSEYV